MKDIQRKVDSRAMREVNRSIVLDIIRRGGRVSRTDLARRSTLTKPTVSAIVEDLIANGIVHEVGYDHTVGVGGRRARLLEFNEASAAYLGIRFGVSAVSVGVADARGELRTVREVPGVIGNPERSVELALGLVDTVLAEAGLPRERLQAVGVTLPGLVAQSTGTVELAPNLEWTSAPVRDLVQRVLNLPVVVMNITNSGALAEGRSGAAKGVRSYVWLYVGTGTGAGIVIDGRLFHGHNGFSGEIGHCPLVLDGPECTCGLRGCLEAVASGWAIGRAAERARKSNAATLLRDLPGPLDAEAVAEAARQGDAEAQRILAEVGNYLGMGLSTLVNLLDPEMVVLAGGVTAAGDYLLNPTRESAAKHTLRGRNVRIVTSTLGDQAGMLGAVLGAMDQCVRSYRVVATGRGVSG
ncbi:MAG: ROK family transcriptional regulator [Pseudomonadota bacterium]|nr:MAG: sugar kinase [Pseudomonadota bacterium]